MMDSEVNASATVSPSPALVQKMAARMMTIGVSSSEMMALKGQTIFMEALFHLLT